MQDRALARKFERYRRRGDVAALGDVFDAVAPELARAASHLVHESSEVDDLIQATFLTAIEKAHSWDGTRRLVPWLMGVLVRHAHSQRRERARTPDPGRLAVSDVSGEEPSQEAERAEASAALAAALNSLPLHYREVLEPLVLEGAPSTDVAVRLGRSPGTVRVQQSRGFELLRRALPRGLAGGLVLGLPAGPEQRVVGHCLEAVRAEVLARATALTAPTAPVPSLLATMTLAQKLVTGVVGLAALAAFLVWSQRSEEDLPPETRVALVPSEPPQPTTLAVPQRPDARPLDVAPSAALTAREVAATYDPAPVDMGDPLASLASASGRVLEQSGAPVAGIAVELHAVGLDALERALDAPLEPCSPPVSLIERVVTNAEGRFRLTGARVNTQAVLGIDLGGARPFARLVDEGFARGRTRELGDIVLPEVAPLVGRVVDERGAPVVFARVRVACTDARQEWLQYLGLGAETPVHVGQGLLSAIIEPPPWLAEAERLLPLALAHTDAEGRFEFEAAPRAGGAWFVDAPGFVAQMGALEAAEPDAPGTNIESRRVEVVLARGRALRGRVLDPGGRPAADIEVRAGTTGALGFSGPAFTPLVHSARSDAQGEFVVLGLVPGQGAMLAARARPGDAWTSIRVQDDGVQTLKVPARGDVEVRVVDRAGAPVAGAELALARPPLFDGLATGAGLLDPWGAVARGVELGDGRHALKAVARGPYKLLVRAPGLATVEVRVVVREGMQPSEVILSTPRVLTVRLVDERTRAPLSGARIAVMERLGKERTLGAATTDGGGVARIEVAEVELDDDVHLRVDHAGYGTRLLALPRDGGSNAVLFARTDDAADDAADAPHELALAPAGSVRIVASRRGRGASPAARLMAELDRPTGQGAYPHYLHRRFGLADEAGVIEVDGLAPGPWRAILYERYLDGDPFDLLDGFWPALVAKVDVDVRAGESVTVDVPFTPPGACTLPEGTASLTVRVTRDGAPVTDRSVALRGLGDLSGDASAALDDRGEATFTGLPSGALEVSVTEGARIGAVWFHVPEASTRIELAPGEAHVHEFEFRMGTLVLRVLGEDGTPAVGVEVSAYSRQVSRSVIVDTDASGIAHLGALHAGPTIISVEDEQRGVAELEVDVPVGGALERELRLSLGVACAGTVRVPAVDARVQAWIHLTFEELSERASSEEAQEPGARRSVTLAVANSGSPFRVHGLAPGRYRATAVSGVHERALVPLDVELPPGGATSLDLRFSFE
jgi:RNA polymerase sigma factor (sigma-70 family)